MEILNFSQLVGNPFTISLIKKGLQKKTLPQFILLNGVYGIGKSSVAELIAMALTCEKPYEGEPCEVCSACLANKSAFRKGGGGVTPFVEKVNMAKVAKEKTMAEQLRSTFQVIHSDRIHVKIFEEFHALSESDQQMMLEETARISPNVFVILTTTRINSVLKEIVSRCLTFTFERLNQGEASILIDRINTKIKLRSGDYELIYRKTNGIPRNIVVLVNFISQVNPTPDELNKLFGNIDKKVFLDLFSNTSNFRLYMEDVERLEEEYSPEIILSQLKEFFIQIIFALEGQIFREICKKDLNLFPAKDAETVYSMAKLLDKVTSDKQGIDFLFMKIRRILDKPMTVQEQKFSAELGQSLKNLDIPIRKDILPLKRFGGGDSDEG